MHDNALKITERVLEVGDCCKISLVREWVKCRAGARKREKAGKAKMYYRRAGNEAKRKAKDAERAAASTDDDVPDNSSRLSRLVGTTLVLAD